MGTFLYVSQYTVLPKSYNYYVVRKKFSLTFMSDRDIFSNIQKSSTQQKV